MDPLREALTAVERELETAEPQLAVLTKRVTALRQTQAGLRSVLDLEPPEVSRPQTQTMRPEGIPSGEAVGHVYAGIARPSTTEGVRAILAEKPDQTVRLDDIRAEFRKRNWVDPEWARPDAAIYAAVVRLTDTDPQVVREGKRLWKFVTTMPTASLSADVIDVMGDIDDDIGALAEVSTS